jgi:hypothetical protein
VQTQQIRSDQNGSQAFAGRRLEGRVKDKFDTLGAGIKHTAIENKLDLGADVMFSRSRSDTTVQATFGGRPSRPRRRRSTA